jgi:hypothetical protein
MTYSYIYAPSLELGQLHMNKLQSKDRYRSWTSYYSFPHSLPGAFTSAKTLEPLAVKDCICICTEAFPVILQKWPLPHHFGICFLQQIYDTGAMTSFMWCVTNKCSIMTCQKHVNRVLLFDLFLSVLHLIELCQLKQFVYWRSTYWLS